MVSQREVFDVMMMIWPSQKEHNDTIASLALEL